MKRFNVLSLLVLMLFLGFAPAIHAQTLPPTGYVNSYAGVSLYGQCVPNARALEFRLTSRTLPYLGPTGVAADLWVVATPGFVKVPNGPGVVPPRYAVIVWSRRLGGTGHCAVYLGMPRPGVARVVDTN